MAIKEAKSDKMFVILNYIFICFMVLIIVYPLLFITIASISDPSLVNTGKVWLWPKGITFEGFERVFQASEVWIGYRNTIFYTVVGTFISLAITIPGAYALSRKELVGRNLIMFLIVFTMFFEGGIIPTYLVVKDLGMVNTVWAILLPQAATVFNIIVARTFFQSTIPKELEEVAAIDGCSSFRMFFQIVIPLSKPIIAVMTLFYAVQLWNEYFQALIYLTDENLYPLQLVLKEILVESQIDPELLMSGGDVKSILEQARIASIMKYALMIISMVPMLILYPFLQRYFIKGVMIGSIKG